MSEPDATGITAQVTGRVAEMRLIGPIYPGGRVSAESIQAALDELDPEGLDELTVTLHGPGGSVHEAMFGYVALRDFAAPVRIRVPALAASAYSMIMMAAEPGLIEVGDVARVMIHNPRIMAVGEAKDMRKVAELLDMLKDDMLKAYRRHVTAAPAKLSKMLDETTWLSAKDAVEIGFASSISKSLKRPKAALDTTALREELAGSPLPGDVSAYLADLEQDLPAQLSIIPDETAPEPEPPPIATSSVAAEVAAYLAAHPLPSVGPPPLAAADFQAITAAINNLPLEASAP